MKDARTATDELSCQWVEPAIKPEIVERCFHSKFGEALPEARSAMEQLTKSDPPKELSNSPYALAVISSRFCEPRGPSGSDGKSRFQELRFLTHKKRGFEMTCVT